MERATARLWRESTRWVIQIDIDGARYTERDYADIEAACNAISQILRQHAERPKDLDETECDSCDEPLVLVTCSQCGVDAFLRTCKHASVDSIREVEEALYCRSCRP
jgi:hypothetical protein